MLQSHTRLAIAASALAVATTTSPRAVIDSTPIAAAKPLAVVPLDSAILKSYKWRSIGPERGGRSIAATGVKGRPREAYFGAVGGGLWKTIDAGITWTPVTDGQVKSASVGAVAVSESNPDVIYIGMGETCIRGNIMAGDGVYKSTDAGKTWTHVGLDAGGTKQNISKIRIHPTNPDIVWVAVFGQHGAPNEERGVFKTADGGKTWRKVLYRDDKTGAIDISVDRTNPDVLYAALWEAYRVEYQMSSGGPGSGLFKSTDGGEHWTEITRNQGLPSGVVGRIGVSVSGADPNRVYALVENENGGLFRSDDAGATWTLANGARTIRQRAFYYTHITADPKNKDIIYALNTSLYRSTDAGKTLTNTAKETHGDHHDLWVDPDDPTHLVNGNDGGGTISYDTGKHWSDENFPTAQFYHVATTKHIPYHVCGSQQDNSTACVSSGGAGGFGGGRGGNPLYTVGGGEPGYIAPDPKNLDVYFGGTNNGGFLTRFDRRTGQLREVSPYPRMFQGESSLEVKERWQWTYPIIFSPVDPNVLYASSQHVWKTTNGGQTWTRISGDLTRHDPKTMGPSGGPITHDMNSPEIYAVVFALGPGKKNVNVIWAGSDDGLIHVTRDGGATWTNVTPKDMPDFGRVSQIDASSFDDGTAYVAVKRPLLNDVSPYIFRTHDFGKTWTKVVNGVRPNDYVHAVREDPTRRGLLYAGAQHGMYISYDDGDSWQPFSLNLPDIPIADVMVEANSIAIATHGRSFYVLDNIEAIRQYRPELASASEPYLFAPAPAIRSGNTVAIRYWLKQVPRSLTLDILDATGKVIRTYKGAPPEDTTKRVPRADGSEDDEDSPRNRNPTAGMVAGINTQTWDLRYAPATTFQGMILWGATTSGPVALPGTYQVRLTVDGKPMTRPVTVKKNPLITDVTLADLKEQFDLAIQIRDKVSEANEAVIRIRDLEKQTAERLTKSPDPALKAAADSFTRHASDVEEAIYQVRNQSNQDPLNFPIRINNRLATLLQTVTTGEGKPIGAARPIFNDLSGELKVQTDRLAKVLADDLAKLNAELKRLGLPEVTMAKSTVS